MNRKNQPGLRAIKGAAPKTLTLVVALTAMLLAGHSTAKAHNWSGYSLVPGYGTTDKPVAAVDFENHLYLFVKDTGAQARMRYQTFDGNYWSGTYVEVPGNGLTTDAMAAAVSSLNTVRAGRKLLLFCRGTDGDVWMNTKAYLGAWTGWQPLPPGGALTNVAPAAATTYSYDQVLTFVIGTNNQIFFNRSSYYDTTSWSGYQAVPGAVSTDVPVAAAWDYNTNRLALVAKQAGSNSVWVCWYTPTGFYSGTWSSWTMISGSGTTNAALAAAWDDSATGDALHLFAKGIIHQGLYVKDFNGSTWSAWSEIYNYGTTDVAPAAARCFSRLFLFVKGIGDKAIYVNVGD